MRALRAKRRLRAARRAPRTQGDLKQRLGKWGGGPLVVAEPVEDPEQAVAIVAAAHQVCPYSNATRGNIDVALTANGRPVP